MPIGNIKKRLGLHKLSGSFLNARSAILTTTIIFAIQVICYIFISGMSLLEALYMVTITFSTVGYGEVTTLDDHSRIMTIIFIFLNIGIFALVLSVFSYYVIQGSIFKRLHIMHIQNRLKKLNNHIIISGYGRYGKEVSTQLLHHKVPFVIIDKDPNVIEGIQQSDMDLLYILGSATDDQILDKAGIDRAQGLITTLPEDGENLYVILSARQLNQELNLISRAHNKTAEHKLKLAGAKHVVLPDQIGGFYMATLINKPETIEFFSFLTNEFESDVGFEELHYDDMPSKCHGMSIAELNIRKASGANIIGCRTSGGKYIINPGPGTLLSPNTSFIIIGDHQQLSALRNHILSFV